MIIIKKYTQFLTISSLNFSKLLFTMYDFNKKLVTYKLVMERKNGYKSKPFMVPKEDKFFYLIETETPENSNKDNVIRYPVSLMNNVIEYLNLKGISNDEISIEEIPAFTGDNVIIKINPSYKIRDYQEEYVKGILDYKKSRVLIDLQTGMGKTFIAMTAISRLGKKFGMVVLPRYIDKWIFDITNLTDVKKEEILVIQGGTTLAKFLAKPKEDFTKYKCIIISLTTTNLFIKRYLNNELDDLDTMTPSNIFKHFGISTVINDETHQEFHNVNRLMLYANVELFIGLTATLVTNDETLDRMYEVVFPLEDRLSNIVAYNKYIKAFAVRYRFNNRRVIRWKSQFGYNQPMFEASILKNSNVRFNYMNMIKQFLDRAYTKRKQPGEKAIVFFSTVEMCKVFISYLKQYKEYANLKISKYTEEDDYEVIEASDILASTPLSLGTAIDVPKLITVLMTVSTDSPQVNTQTLGRLRDIKGRDVIFINFWSNDIPPHKKYNRNRLRLFRSRTKSISIVDYNKTI